MNYLITYACPKACSFCFFPKLSKSQENEMSLETFKACFTHARKLGLANRVAILGGEPTVAKNFKDILSYILKYQEYTKYILIFSNLFGQKNLEWLLEQDKPTTPFSIIWNNSEMLDLPNEKQKQLYKIAHALRSFCSISCSLTLTSSSTKESLAYLAELKDVGITDLRFAVDSQWRNITESQADYIVSLVEWLKDCGFNVNHDGCGFLSPALFSPALIARASACMPVQVCCLAGFVGDILPDGAIIPCMPWIETPNKLQFTEVDNIAQAHLFYAVRDSGHSFCPAIQNLKRHERNSNAN